MESEDRFISNGQDTQSRNNSNTPADKQTNLLGGALFIILEGGALLLAFLALGGPTKSARSENWESKPDVDKSCLEPIIALWSCLKTAG